MMHESKSDLDDKALLQAIISSGESNPLYAPSTGKASLRDKIIVALFVCFMLLVVCAFIAFGIFLIYLMYIFLREGVPLIGCCGMKYR